MQIDPEFFLYGITDRGHQADHLIGRCAAFVDDGKRVFFGNTDVACRVAFMKPDCSISQAAGTLTRPSGILKNGGSGVTDATNLKLPR